MAQGDGYEYFHLNVGADVQTTKLQPEYFYTNIGADIVPTQLQPEYFYLNVDVGLMAVRYSEQTLAQSPISAWQETTQRVTILPLGSIKYADQFVELFPANRLHTASLQVAVQGDGLPRLHASSLLVATRGITPSRLHQSSMLVAVKEIQVQLQSGIWTNSLPISLKKNFEYKLMSLNPRVLYKLNGNMNDSSGNSRNGTVTGSPVTSGSLVPSDPTATSMRVGSSSLGYFSSSSDAALGGAPSGGHAMIFCFKRQGESSSGVLTRDSTSSGGSGWLLYHTSGAGGNYQYRVGGGTEVNTGISTVLFNDNPHLVVFVMKQGDVRLYIDGTRVYTGNSTGSNSVVLPWRIGVNGTQIVYAYGSYSHWGLYDPVLITDQSVSDLYDAWTA
jgi:hypothetical protein